MLDLSLNTDLRCEQDCWLTSLSIIVDMLPQEDTLTDERDYINKNRDLLEMLKHFAIQVNLSHSLDTVTV